MRTNGTPPSTYAVTPPWSVNGTNGLLRAVLPDAFLVAADPSINLGQELYRWDGVGGLQLVSDIAPGPASSYPSSFATVPAGVILVASTAATGAELWLTDGTPGGTTSLGEVLPGTAYPGFQWATPLGDLVIFAATDGVTGQELWRTDGTAAGTALLADIMPGIDSSYPHELERAGDRVFFPVFDADGGPALWSTDGTTAGTVEAASEASAAIAMYSSIVACGSGELVLLDADDGAHGIETWTSDGTLAGTKLVADVAPGPGNGAGGHYTRLGDRIFFAADDGVVGKEVHSISVIDLGGWVAEPFGHGCGASLGFSGEARLGKLATLELTAAPLAPGLLYMSPEPAFTPLTHACKLYLKTPALLAPVGTDGAGFASLSLLIPNTPALLGLRLAIQGVALTAGGPVGGTLQVSNGLELVIGS